MRGILLAAVVTLVPPLTAQTEPETPTRAFLEISTDQERPFRHQPIRVRLRIGVDQAFARDHLIQLFRTPLDLPVQLQAPWLDRLEGAPSARPTANRALRIAVNQAAEAAQRLPDQQRGGRTFTVLLIERRYLPERVGTLKLAAATLEFAHTTGFREDFLRGRVPIDQTRARVLGPTLTLEVRALPTTDRPASFSGAVGQFQLRAEARPRSLNAGQQLKLTLRLEGEGNFDHFEVPALVDHPKLHVLGRVEHKTPGSRVIVYDIAAQAGVRAIPSIPFSYFAVGPGGTGRYLTIETAEIPLEVRGSSPEADLRPLGTPGIDDIFALKSQRESALLASNPAPPGWLLLLLLAGLPWLLSLGLRSMLRLRTVAANPARQRSRGAQAAFLLRIDANPTQLADAFAEYLAARLNCSAAAVITHDLRTQLEAAGIDVQLAQATETRLEQLFATRYQGASALQADQDLPLAEVRALVQTLETVFLP